MTLSSRTKSWCRRCLEDKNQSLGLGLEEKALFTSVAYTATCVQSNSIARASSNKGKTKNRYRTSVLCNVLSLPQLALMASINADDYNSMVSPIEELWYLREGMRSVGLKHD